MQTFACFVGPLKAQATVSPSIGPRPLRANISENPALIWFMFQKITTTVKSNANLQLSIIITQDLAPHTFVFQQTFACFVDTSSFCRLFLVLQNYVYMCFYKSFLVLQVLLSLCKLLIVLQNYIFHMYLFLQTFACFAGTDVKRMVLDCRATRIIH